MIYIGIDPGCASGAISIELNGVTRVTSMSKLTEHDIKDVFLNLKKENPNEEFFAVIEEIGAMPGDGRSSLAKFVGNWAFIRGVLSALNIPFERPRPQVWMRELKIGVRDKTLTTSQWKAQLRAKAQHLYPDLKILADQGDAVLIMEYAKRLKNNDNRDTKE